jgi:hypothetical protein
MAKARPLRNASRKPQAKAEKGTRIAPDRKTAPARAAKPLGRTRVEAEAVAPVTAAARQVAAPAQPVVPPPLPAPIASFTF